MGQCSSTEGQDTQQAPATQAPATGGNDSFVGFGFPPAAARAAAGPAAARGGGARPRRRRGSLGGKNHSAITNTHALFFPRYLLFSLCVWRKRRNRHLFLVATTPFLWDFLSMARFTRHSCCRSAVNFVCTAYYPALVLI